MTTGRDPKKFDPARADVLDAPERSRFLPIDPLVAMLELGGDERAVDYDTGTGQLTFPVAEALIRGGEVLAVDESEEMYQRLVARAARAADVPLLVPGNHVSIKSRSVQRVLAVNLLCETLLGGEFGDGIGVDDYMRAIWLPPAGALRASLGLASNFREVDRFPAFAGEFADLTSTPDDLPERHGC